MFIMLLTIKISNIKRRNKYSMVGGKLLREKVAVWDAQLSNIFNKHKTTCILQQKISHLGSNTVLQLICLASL
jgi:hypothetical protein